MDNSGSINKANQNDPKRFIKSTHLTNESETFYKTKMVLNQDQIDNETKYDDFMLYVLIWNQRSKN